MAKDVTYRDDLQHRVQRGVDKLADTVSVTLGPTGRNVMLTGDKPLLPPFVTNDGATIAKSIELSDPVENIGIQMVKEAVLQTREIAGDGSTTALVLAQHILREGFKCMAAGANPVELRKGISRSAQLATMAVKKLAKPVETREALAGVAGISAGDEDIGRIIAEALDRVGKDGVVTVEETGRREMTLQVLDGMQFERGFLHPEFATDPQQTVAELDNPYILITDKKITSAWQLVPIVEQVASRGRSLLIIAEDVSGDAMGLLVMNKQRGLLKVCAVHPPAYGDGRIARMEDLAFYTGGELIRQDAGHRLQEVTANMLGSAASVRVEKRSTAIAGGAGGQEAIDNRTRYLRMLIDRSAYEFDRDKLKERLAKLVGGTAVIHVGGLTEAEMKEKKFRVDAALHAARAAVREGVVAGGGATLIHVMPAVRSYMASLSGDQRTGARILLEALKVPARQIADNEGYLGSAVAAEIERRPQGTGFDVRSGTYVDMVHAGILDSVSVTCLALERAASVSSMLLTMDACLTEHVPGREGEAI